MQADQDTQTDPMAWQPVIFDRTRSEDSRRMNDLVRSGQVWCQHDTIEQQLRDLIQARAPQKKGEFDAEYLAASIQEIVAGVPLADFGRWVYYPWSGQFVHTLPPGNFTNCALIATATRSSHKIRNVSDASAWALSVCP